MRESTYPQLGSILRAAQLTSTSDSDKEKVGKVRRQSLACATEAALQNRSFLASSPGVHSQVATLWGQKQIYDEARVALLLNAATGSNPIEAPPSLIAHPQAAGGHPHVSPVVQYHHQQPALPQPVTVGYSPQPAYGAVAGAPPGAFPMGDLRANGMVPPPLGGFPPPQLGSGIAPAAGSSWLPAALTPLQPVRSPLICPDLACARLSSTLLSHHHSFLRAAPPGREHHACRRSRRTRKSGHAGNT